MNRANSVDEVAQLILGIERRHPLRVAIDGRTASGKSTFAARLADALRPSGRPVISISIDGFHRPAAERQRRGRYSPEGYYHDARDLDAFKALVLEPLGPDGSLMFVTSSFDLANDCALEVRPEAASRDAILLVDGTFLQRRELRANFDFTIFIDTPEDVARQRGIARDSDRVGGTAEAEALYDRRYLPAFRLYELEARPQQNADLVVSLS